MGGAKFSQKRDYVICRSSKKSNETEIQYNTIYIRNQEAYSKPCQASEIEIFAKIKLLTFLKPLKIFTKSSILNV